MYFEEGYGISGVKYTMSDGEEENVGDLTSSTSQFYEFDETVHFVGFNGVVKLANSERPHNTIYSLDLITVVTDLEACFASEVEPETEP